MEIIFTNPMTTMLYTLHASLVLRAPARPFQQQVPGNIIQLLLHDAVFMEAVYLASPVLYRECVKLREGQLQDEKEISAIEISLVKYYQRMYSRSTPFGLFSGCTLTGWKEEDEPITLNPAEMGRHTRFDMHYLCALAQYLGTLPAIKERLLYYPNNSCYTTPTEIRYVEYGYEANRRVFKVSGLDRTDYLGEVLEAARAGITLQQLRQLLVTDEISEAEATEYIEALLASQVLVSELEPAITGSEFMQQLLQKLEKINQPPEAEITATIVWLQQLQQKTEALDAQTGNPIQQYLDIMQLAEQYPLPFEENKLFQTDMVPRAGGGGLSKQYQQTLREAVQVLFALNPDTGNSNLQSFVTRFRERYEDAEMPLLAVLDGETGIGYPENYGQAPSTLLENLHLAEAVARKQELSWDEKQTWLLRKMQDAMQQGLYEIEITAEDIKDLKPNWEEGPPSFSVMFRIAGEGDVVIDNCGGSSAAALLGRFAYSDDTIKELVRDITHAERQQNTGVAFAEVVHLPESRVGNILLHPVFHPYEIPYLAASSLPVEQQLAPGDLYISVKGNRILLRSATLNKEVIPRLSSAHNFSYNSLPVYRFLCDLQTQQLKAGANFSWGALATHFRFLPRVRYGKAILHEATWQLTKKDVALLLTALRQNDFTAIANWQLPTLLVLADGDNELLLDRNNPLSVAAFVQTVKNRSAIMLREFLYHPQGLVQSTSGEPYISQFIASFIKTEPVYKPAAVNTTPATPRIFGPGSEWLYYKIYCGVHASEQILAEHIYPAIEQLLAEGLVHKWFFIRYVDPSFHLRLRLHLVDVAMAGTVMSRLYPVFQPLQEQRLVWKLQTDTYQRELERYGDSLVVPAEELFFIDSEIKIRFLQLTEGDGREQYRWPWAMRQVDWLLDCFDYSLADKELLLKGIKTAFAAEFKMDKDILQQMNKKYTATKQLVEAAMLGRADEEDMATLTGIFDPFTVATRQLAAAITAGCDNDTAMLNNLLGSYIHMLLNRIFPDRPRQQEAVLYDYLYKWYVSLKYRR